MKKILWWLFSIIIIIGIGLFFGAKYLQRNWKPLLEEQLKQAVINSTDSLYKIEYKSLDVNPINGNLKLVDFKLTPLIKVYEKLKITNEAPDNLYELSVDELIINKANAKEAVSTKKLNIATIIIDHPQLKITNNRQPYNDITDSIKKKKNPYELIKEIFKELKINTIQLKDVDFTFVNISNKQKKQTSLKNLNITIKDLLIDSLASQDKNRVYYTKNVEINIKNYQISTPDSLYFVKTDKLSFSTLRNELLLKNVKMEPRLGKAEFHQKAGYAKDRFDLDFENILIKDVDFDLFLNQQILMAKSLSIQKARVDVYNNNAYHRKRTDKTGKFPHQQLLNVALDMRIKQVILNNVNISYAEFDAKSKRTGIIKFNNVRGTISNVTNNIASLKKDDVMMANVKAEIFGKAPVSLNMKFYMSNALGAFDYSGTVGAFNGRILNEIVKPLGMAEIKSATVSKVTFDVKANQNIAKGTMQFYYSDLNVSILKREENGNLKNQGFISTVTNGFIIKSENPSKKGEFTEGRILYSRPYYASFFNYLWQSLFTGVKESVGVSREKEAKLKKSAAKIGSLVDDAKNAFSSIKENLKERKEKREVRRDEKKIEKKQEQKKKAELELEIKN